MKGLLTMLCCRPSHRASPFSISMRPNTRRSQSHYWPPKTTTCRMRLSTTRHYKTTCTCNVQRFFPQASQPSTNVMYYCAVLCFSASTWSSLRQYSFSTSCYKIIFMLRCLTIKIKITSSAYEKSILSISLNLVQ